MYCGVEIASFPIIYKKPSFDLINKNVETDNEIFEAVKKAKPDMESYPWPLITPNAKDLVKRMLSVNPKERPNAAAVLSMFLTSDFNYTTILNNISYVIIL